MQLYEPYLIILDVVFGKFQYCFCNLVMVCQWWDKADGRTETDAVLSVCIIPLLDCLWDVYLFDLFILMKFNAVFSIEILNFSLYVLFGCSGLTLMIFFCVLLSFCCDELVKLCLDIWNLFMIVYPSSEQTFCWVSMLLT